MASTTTPRESLYSSNKMLTGLPLKFSFSTSCMESFNHTMLTFGKFPNKVGMHPLMSVCLANNLRKMGWSSFSGGIPLA